MSDSTDFTAQQALSDSTSSEVLAQIAADRPDLRPFVALNPVAYTGLLLWLAGLRDPAVDAALAVRAAQAPAPQPPAPAVETSLKATPPDAASKPQLGAGIAGVPASSPPVPAEPSTPAALLSSPQGQGRAPAASVGSSKGGLSGRRRGALVAAVVGAVILTAGGVLGWRLLTGATQGAYHVVDRINGLHDEPLALAVDSEAGLLYVANQTSIEGMMYGGDGSVAVIDTATRQVVDKIPIGGELSDLALDAGAGVLYAATSGTVSVVDTVTRQVIGAIPIDGFLGGAIACDSAAGVLYVTNSNDDTVSVIDMATSQVVDRITVGGYPKDVAVDAVAGMTYVTNEEGDTLTVIDSATHQVVDTITVGDGPWGVALDVTFGMAYVTNWNDGTVSVIDTGTHQVVDTITVGDGIEAVAVDTPAGVAYVTRPRDDTISVIDTGTRRVVNTVPVDSSRLRDVAVDVSSGVLYVADGGEWVSVIEKGTE